MMIALMPLLLAGQPIVAGPCVEPIPAGAVAKGKSWFINGEVFEFGERRWEKYGLPRVLMPQEVVQIGEYKGAAVYKEAGLGVGEYDVLYVLVDLTDCSFQPYQVKG